jgi:hypothetical protein
MTSFKMDRTASTPSIELSAGEHLLTFEGDCYPEDPVLFFAPLAEALVRHLGQAQPLEFRASFRLRYVNSASTKALRRLFGYLDQAGRRGTSVRVLWVHDRDDDESPELVDILAGDLDFVDVAVQAV